MTLTSCAVQRFCYWFLLPWAGRENDWFDVLAGSEFLDCAIIGSAALSTFDTFNAFDKVRHWGLLPKLLSFNITGSSDKELELEKMEVWNSLERRFGQNSVMLGVKNIKQPWCFCLDANFQMFTVLILGSKPRARAKPENCRACQVRFRKLLLVENRLLSIVCLGSVLRVVIRQISTLLNRKGHLILMFFLNFVLALCLEKQRNFLAIS